MTTKAFIPNDPKRRSLVVQYTLPLKDRKGKSGRWFRKSLGTSDRAQAEQIVAELSNLLGRRHSYTQVGVKQRSRGAIHRLS